MLSGAHVTLRGVRQDDLLTLWKFHNDLELELASSSDPPLPQALERLAAEFVNATSTGGRDGSWFAIDVGGVCVGECALDNFDFASASAELCITIGERECWGRGYGREAVELLLWHAFMHRNIRRVWLRVQARNERAIRSYRAVGFVEEGRLRQHVWNAGAYDDAVIMGILRNEWQATHVAAD
jgi:RimJ/RimL family protein N-acetyltransferase